VTELADWDSLPDDLASLATQLAATEPTERTADALRTFQRAFENDWRTKKQITCAQAIPIPVPRDKALHPTGCELLEAQIHFTFRLGANFDPKGLPECSEFQVCVKGAVEYDRCIVNLQDHWRVDTHNFGGVPREPHAHVHFQRGGRAQDAWAGLKNFIPGPDLPPKEDDYWLSLLQSPGPRIPFPPVCPVLAIDFVIGQHDGEVWHHLRNVPEYRELVAKAQARIWTPFFEGLSDIGQRKRWLGPMLL